MALKRRLCRAADALDPHLVKIDDLRIHYIEAGEGDPILFLYGASQRPPTPPTTSSLGSLRTHRAIALVLQGHGLSDNPFDVAYGCPLCAGALNAFLEALDIRRAHLVVHDLGGLAGITARESAAAAQIFRQFIDAVLL